MTDAEKREKVIRGLEKLREYADSEVHPIVSPDNWGIYSELRDLIDEAEEDALALLKAQEPRVMSLEEYKVWADIPFCERDPIFHEMKLRRGPVTGWTNTAECSIENYGKTERCWTSRPTDEQRQVVKWE